MFENLPLTEVMIDVCGAVGFGCLMILMLCGTVCMLLGMVQENIITKDKKGD